jgi:hypothetical protein
MSPLSTRDATARGLSSEPRSGRGNGRIFVAAAVVLTWTSARAIRPSRTNARRCVPLPDEREPAAPVSITRERLQPEDGASVVRAGRSAERHQTVRGSDVTEHPRFANAPKSLLISVCVYTPGCRCKAFKLFPGGGPAGVATIAHASPKPRRSSTADRPGLRRRPVASVRSEHAANRG